MAKSSDGGASFGSPATIAAAFGRFQVSIPAQASRKALIYITGGAYKIGMSPSLEARRLMMAS